MTSVVASVCVSGLLNLLLSLAPSLAKGTSSGGLVPPIQMLMLFQPCLRVMESFSMIIMIENYINYFYLQLFFC